MVDPTPDQVAAPAHHGHDGPVLSDGYQAIAHHSAHALRRAELVATAPGVLV